MRPTPAFVRALGGAVFIGIWAIVTRRVDLVLIGVPLALCAGLALARGPRVASPSISTSSTRIHEGQGVELAVRSSTRSVTSIAWPATPGASFVPQGAALADVTAPDRGVTITAEMNRWGHYRLGPAVYLVTDILGAYRSTGLLGGVNVSVVPLVEASAAQARLRHPIGVTGQHTSTARGDGSALADVRPFQAGDRLRRINWRVSNRTRALHTNATFTDRDTDVWLVLDTLAELRGVDVGLDEGTSSLDLTVRAATSLARHYLTAGDRVGVHDLGSTVGALRLASGTRQFTALSELFAQASASDRLRTSVRRIRHVRSGSLVFCCSPLLNDKVIDEVGRLVGLGAQVVVVDTMPPELGSLAELPRRRQRDELGFWRQAWAIRRAERDAVLDTVAQLGVPVVAWRGPESLGVLLTSMSLADRAPRARRRA